MTLMTTIGRVSAAALLAIGIAAGGAPSVQAQTLSLRISGENPATGFDLQMAQRFADNLKGTSKNCPDRAAGIESRGHLAAGV